MLAQESGEWDSVREMVKELKLSQIDVQADYWHAMQWARTIAGK